jgi:hypothetical protein
MICMFVSFVLAGGCRYLMTYGIRAR